jgi:DNA-binding SARP family transcriptional activator
VPLPLGSRQQRALLGLLALQPGRAVPAEWLLDSLWRGKPPASAPGTLQSYVSRLRGALGERELIASEAGGYRLALAPEQIDSARFESLAHEGHDALQAGRFGEAAAQLEQALGLWRGPALADFAYDDEWATVEANRLEGVRLAARKDLFDAQLALGSHGEIVPELERLAGEHPLDERLRGQLALALYRCGRQAEALDVIRVTRELLRDELGIDPSPPLRSLETQILNHDPGLAWDGPEPPAEPPAAARRTVLPRPSVRNVGLEAGGIGFVGREREQEVLAEAIESATSGRGRIVFVEGEPGIGKSRLALEAARLAASRGMPMLFGSCFEGDGAPSLWPWLPILRSAVGLLPPDDRARLAAPELAQLLPELAPAGAPPPAPWTPDADARFHLYEEAVDVLARLAGTMPLMLLLDDAHWADPASMHLFEILAPRVVDLPMLVVVTLREGAGRNDAFDAARGTVSRYPWTTHLSLSGLGEHAVAEIVAAAGGIAPQRSLVLAIHARTEGNPFFVHELVRLLRDEGMLDEERRALYTGIPAGVRDVVGRRLQALPESTRATLELAACFGRTFVLSLLARADACAADDCLEKLEPALESRLVYKAEGVGVYRFSHAIVRETIVSHLSASQAARLHKRAADALLEDGDNDDLAELAAEHLWQAIDIVDPAEALPVLERAATVALRRAAYESSETLLQRALQLSTSDERTLGLQLQLSSLQMMTLGYSAPEVIEGFRRVAELARAAGTLGEVVQSLHGLASGLAVAGRFDEAREVAERALAAAEELGDPLSMSFGHHIFGIANFHLGQLTVARREFRETQLAWERAEREGASAFEHAVPPSMIGPAFGSLVELLGGDTAEAHRLREQMRASAAEVDSPFAHQVAAVFSAWLAAFEGDPDAAAAYVEEGSRNVGDNVFPIFAAVAPVFGAWARGLRGDADAPVAIDSQLELMESLNARTMHHFLLGLKADVQEAQGDQPAALDTLDAAIAESERFGEVYWLPELHRRRGELLLAAGRREEGVAELELAERTAAAQESSGLELRALTSLEAAAGAATEELEPN